MPEGLDRAFQKMLAKDPDERQQSMAELLDDLADREELTTASPLLATTTGEALRDTVAEHAQEDGLSFLAEDIPILQSPPLVIPRRVRTAMPLATRFRRSTMHVMVALAAASFMVLAGIVIKIMTPEGTVIVEVNVSDATIFVSDYQGTLVLERQASQETVSLELEPGGYHIRVEQDGKLLLAETALEAAQIKIDVPLEDEPGGKDGPPSSRPLAGIDLLSLIDVQRDTYLGRCAPGRHESGDIRRDCADSLRAARGVRVPGCRPPSLRVRQLPSGHRGRRPAVSGGFRRISAGVYEWSASLRRYAIA